MNTNNRYPIRFNKALQYVTEHFPHLSRERSIVLANAIVNALFPTSSSDEPLH
jgi:hypothetical protein